MNYIEDFLERNDVKSFVTNLKKYGELKTTEQKLKCISSFYTHLCIDAEINNISNKEIRIKVLSILTEFEYHEVDNFIPFLAKILGVGNDEG